MEDYWLAICAFLAVVIGVSGETRDKNKSGLNAIRPLGVFVLLVGAAVLALSIAKSRTTDATNAQKDREAIELKGKVSSAEGLAVLANSKLDDAKKQHSDDLIRLDELRNMQHKFDGVQRSLNDSVEEARKLDAQQRAARESVSAKAMRVAFDNSLCAFNLLYRERFTSYAKDTTDLANDTFVQFLLQQDLSKPVNTVIYPEFNGKPLYMWMDSVTEKSKQELDAELKSSSVYLPTTLVDEIIDYWKKLYLLEGVRYHAAAVAINAQITDATIKPIKITAVVSSEGEKDYRAILIDANRIDKTLSQLSGDTSSRSFALFACSV